MTEVVGAPQSFLQWHGASAAQLLDLLQALRTLNDRMGFNEKVSLIINKLPDLTLMQIRVKEN